MPPPPLPAITAGAPACPIGSAAGRRDAEKQGAAGAAHASALPRSAWKGHGPARGAGTAQRWWDAGQRCRERFGIPERCRCEQAGWLRGPGKEQLSASALGRLQALILQQDKEHRPCSSSGMSRSSASARGSSSASSAAAGALTRAWKSRGEQRKTALGTKRPPAATQKALRNPSQAAKKQMRDSSVGHQAPSGARGAPQAAPAGARHAERCQEAVPAGRGEEAALGPPAASPLCQASSISPGLASSHPRCIHSLGRSGSTEAPAQPCVAPWPPSPHHHQPSNQPPARRPHQAQLFPPHSLFFFFFFLLLFLFLGPRDAGSRSFHDLTIPRAACTQPNEPSEAGREQPCAAAASWGSPGAGCWPEPTQHHPTAPWPSSCGGLGDVPQGFGGTPLHPGTSGSPGVTHLLVLFGHPLVPVVEHVQPLGLALPQHLQGHLLQPAGRRDEAGERGPKPRTHHGAHPSLLIRTSPATPRRGERFPAAPSWDGRPYFTRQSPPGLPPSWERGGGGGTGWLRAAPSPNTGRGAAQHRSLGRASGLAMPGSQPCPARSHPRVRRGQTLGFEQL